jgi:hypothetical protein
MTAMPEGSAVPWAPEDLPLPRDELRSWNYVVLEEIVDEVALLRRWSWPVVDPLGRLLWLDNTEHNTGEAAIDVRLLKEQLYQPNELEREPRCGDTFAIPPHVAPWHGSHAHDARALFGHHDVFDVSADAREAAKIAYQASVGAIQPAVAAGNRARAKVHRTLEGQIEHPLQPMRVEPPTQRSGRART